MADGSSNWDLIKEIVADALEHPAADREPFVRDRCHGDEGMIAQVTELLGGYDAIDGMLGSKADAWLGHNGPDMLGLAGQRVGRYTLEKLLAEGGMGAVYIAQQSSPNRRVAIKLLRHSLPMLDAVHRFKREAAVLGRLHHPNIARIYESGVHQVGSQPATPFLAMELVEGMPLNRYVVENKLARDDRMRLMIKVVLAVHAAHQQAVIHRDIKPANVLVQSDGEPKVLDFGIARLGDAEESQATWQTTVGVLLGTPGYMSPEQASGNQSEVDVRSDVWSLGVLLYELLTGRLPLEMKGKSVSDILRTLEVSEPRPIGQIDPSLRGDLETVVAKAMTKDKTHRYASAEAFANDLRNVLEYQPIVARLPSRWYRARKFIRRNRTATTLSALLVATLLAGTIGLTSLFVRERSQRNRAEAVNAFLNDVVSHANPYSGGKDLTMREVMAKAESRVSQDFAGQPEIEAELRRTIGWAYYNLSDFPAAESNLARSKELFKATLGEGAFQTLRSEAQLVSALRMLGRTNDALALADSGYANAVKLLGEDHPLSLELEVNRAAVYTEMGDKERAEKTYKELVPRLRRVLGEGNEQVLLAENNYGYMLMAFARYAEAEPIFESVIRRIAATSSMDNPELFATRSNLLTTKTNLGKLEECEAGYRSLSADVRRVLGEQHRSSTAVDSEFSQLLGVMGKYDESVELQKSVVRRSHETLGADHGMTLKWELFLTYRLLMASRFNEAEAAAQEFLPRARRALGEDHLTTLLIEDNLARALSGQKRYSEAEPIFRSVIPRGQKLVGDMNNWYVNARFYFAKCLNGLAKHDEALENLLQAKQISEQLNLVSVSPPVRREIAQTYLQMGRVDEAERVLIDAVDKDEKLFNRSQVQKTTEALAQLYDRIGKPEEASRWRATTRPATAPANR